MFMGKTLDCSRKEYDKIHSEIGFGEEEEYYRVIGTLLRGTKSVDIGCGYGYIEHYSPNTVAVDFCEEALKIAKKNGAKFLVKAPAEMLPFKDNQFEVSLSLGVLEHCYNQKKSVKEMVRISGIQIIIAHARLPFGLEYIRKPILSIFGLKDQPIENPLSFNQIEKMLLDNGSRILVRGVWNYIDLRWIFRKIPYGILKIPSHHFIIAIKTKNLKRRFLGDNNISIKKINKGINV